MIQKLQIPSSNIQTNPKPQFSKELTRLLLGISRYVEACLGFGSWAFGASLANRKSIKQKEAKLLSKRPIGPWLHQQFVGKNAQTINRGRFNPQNDRPECDRLAAVTARERQFRRRKIAFRSERACTPSCQCLDARRTGRRACSLE